MGQGRFADFVVVDFVVVDFVVVDFVVDFVVVFVVVVVVVVVGCVVVDGGDGVVVVVVDYFDAASFGGLFCYCFAGIMLVFAVGVDFAADFVVVAVDVVVADVVVLKMMTHYI